MGKIALGVETNWNWIDTALAKEGLEKLSAVLQKADVEFWLDCGTLLGAVREKNFIEYDYDTDLSMKISDVDKVLSLREELKSQGILMELQKHNNVESMFVFFYTTRIKIDLYIWHKIEMIYRKPLWYERGGNVNEWIIAEVDSKFYDSLDKILFLGKEYLIPSNVRQYLTLLYDNWETPRVGPSAFNLTQHVKKGAFHEL